MVIGVLLQRNQGVVSEERRTEASGMPEIHGNAPIARITRVSTAINKQLRPGQHIEEIDCARLPNLPVKAHSMLLGSKGGITIAQGWPPGLVGWMCGNDILPIPAGLPLLFQPLSFVTQHRWRLSKRHCL
jgi:hypothetical protein